MKSMLYPSTVILGVVLLLNPPHAIAQNRSAEIFDYSVVYHSFSGTLHCIFLRNGDVYFRGTSDADYRWPDGSAPQTLGNFWGNLTPRTDLLRYRTEASSIGVWHYVLLSNGDMYRNLASYNGTTPFSGGPFYLGNFWSNPISTDKSTWGGVKEEFKK